MKKYYTALLMILIGFSAQSQQKYTSNNNYKGTWEAASTWTKSDAGMANTPGENAGSSYIIDIFGVIRRAGDLTFSGSAAVTLTDTLWVEGNLTVTGGATLTIEDTGLLIVEGDLDTGGGTLTVNRGRVIVKSNLSSSGGSGIENPDGGSNAFYVFGSTSRNGGAEFNGSRNAADGYFLTEEDLYNNDPSLYNFVTTGTLPVEFLYVNAVSVNNIVKISWATGSELNNDFFTIERSIDGLTFQEIGTVDGAGNSAETIEYLFEDYSPNNGVNYYRVKQTDFDGKYDYSVLVHIFNEQVRSLEVTAYPNPVTDQLNVRVDGFGSEEVMIQLTDSRGMNVFSQTYDANFDNVAKINVSGLTKGIYIVTLKSALYTLTKSVVVR
ncbi:T9SS type A sorting domain-containing protein [Fulvivirga sediminis]|uniref:T9SS type A sorting domain-containing protein n=1 Tax=Fulvivirga sediminis TaxID=2803949 RepID=A0A937JZF7_9BACT|nr:T9SS type A sorting domain-containing protein [Fulvivirga sediminis]MBL3656619.1 T9SS type A sorting domain-containing protein [Fulvivirga sediminis]